MSPANSLTDIPSTDMLKRERIFLKSSILLPLLFVLSISTLYASVYELETTLDASSGTLHVNMTVYWANELDQDATSVTFLLYPNLLKRSNPKISSLAVGQSYPLGFDAGFIRIEQVTGENQENLEYKLIDATEGFLGQRYSTEDVFLRISLSHPLPSGESTKIRIKFRTKFPMTSTGDETRMGGVFFWRFAWYPVELMEPGKPAFKPHHWKLRLNLPENYKAITSGVLSDDGWIDSKIPMLSCPVVFTKLHKKYVFSNGTHTVEVYHLNGQESKARRIATYALEVLDYYEKRYGQLDYSTIRIVQDLPAGLFGMTADGLVILGDGAFTGADLLIPGFIDPALHFLIAHELAHLWFGVGVGVDFSNENHLSESLAQYAAVELVESIYGQKHNIFNMKIPDLFVRNVKSQLLLDSWAEQAVYQYQSLLRDGLDGAVAVKMDEGYSNTYSVLWYQKGLLAMRNLEVAIGKEKLQQVLKSYYERFKHKTVDEEDFLNVLAEYGGERAVRIYEELFKTSKALDYAVNMEGNTVRIKNNGEMNVPVELLLNFTDGSTELTLITGEKVLEFDKSVKQVSIDPYFKSLDCNRLNNHYPILVVNEIRPPDKKEASDFSVLDSLRVYPVTSFTTDDEGNMLVLTGAGVEYYDHWKTAFGARLTLESQVTDLSSVVLRQSDYFFHGWRKFNSYLQGELFVLGRTGEDASPAYGLIETQLSLGLPETLDLGYTAPYRMVRWNLGTMFSISTLGYKMGAYVVFDNTSITGSVLMGELSLESEDFTPPVPKGSVEFFQGWRYGPIGLSARGAFSFGEAPSLFDFTLSSDISTSKNYARLEGSLMITGQQPVRSTAYNLLALRGIGVGIKYGYLKTWSPDHQVYGFDLSLVPQTFSIFESPVLFGLQFMIYSIDGGSPNAVLGIGLGLDDMIHTSYSLW